MKNFELHNPQTVDQATQLLAQPSSSAMSGGQDLLGLMKDYIVSPDRVVNLKHIRGLDKIEHDPAKGLHLGALVTLTDIAEHPVIWKDYPVLAEAAGSVASLQIRNVGTVGGNICQRPRCWYFRNEHIKCLKKGGDHCYAAGDTAENKYHAIFGQGPCHIVYPSDVAPALACLGATVTVSGPSGDKRIAISDFYVLPEDGGIAHETVLKAGEIVTGIDVPASSRTARSIYLKFKEKESFDWALSSVAMALDMNGDIIREAHIVLGGVAPVPWRASAAEAALKGKTITSDAAIQAAAHAATQGAQPLAQNGYKIALTQALVRRAVTMLQAGPRSAYKPEEGLWTV
jgi:xanthine dehydrogenase YagS FAD-binding subunit